MTVAWPQGCNICLMLKRRLWKRKDEEKTGGTPVGWSAPLAWSWAVGEDASPLTWPHPSSRHHLPLLSDRKKRSLRVGKLGFIIHLLLSGLLPIKKIAVKCSTQEAQLKRFKYFSYRTAFKRKCAFALPIWSFLCRKDTLRMTAILVFSSPSFVPLLAAFMSCWTWSGESRKKKKGILLKQSAEIFGGLTSGSAPLEKSGAQCSHHESHQLQLPASRCTASNQRVFEPIVRRVSSTSQSPRCIRQCRGMQLTTPRANQTPQTSDTPSVVVFRKDATSGK